MQVGFAGLGHMGMPMVRNLMRAGHQVVVFNRTRSVAEDLGKDGASVADTPADAGKAGVVITMLSDDQAVEHVTLGSKGIAEGLPKGGLHVSMSTISPELSRQLAVEHKERGQRYVSAPVFGRPEAAAAAKLFIVAAGENNAIATAKPLFDALGQRVFDVGEQPEQANLVKVSGNFMIMCVLESLGEVFTVARKAGMDPRVVLEVLTSTLFGSPVYTTYGQRIIEKQFSPAGFKMPLGLKDVRLMLQAAEALTVPLPFADVIRDRFLSAIANGNSELDWSAMTLAIEQSAGITTTD